VINLADHQIRRRPVLNRPGFRTPFRSWEGWRDARQEL
jgi:hypothetical protein